MAGNKTAVFLLNLGGPENLDEVGAFLFRLFADPAILNYPAPLRLPLAALIAALRRKKALAIYRAIGGGSPLRAYTEEQAHALEKTLGPEFRCFVSMRYATPRAMESVRAAKSWGATRFVLLPMYPHYSHSTTGSSFKDMTRAFKACGIDTETVFQIPSYPVLPGFIEALTGLIRPAYALLAAEAKAKNLPKPRLLLSAHGLPQKFIDAGDPYAAQCEQSARAITQALAIENLDVQLCYQSRVGRLEWLKPYTEDEIRRAGDEQRPILIAPLAFTADNSETLYEINQLYRDLAKTSGVPLFAAVPCVNAAPTFIAGLAGLVRQMLV